MRWIGPGYPFAKRILGYPNIKTDIELIKDSIFQILHTRKGERFFNREFGSDLYKLIFEPNDEILKDLIKEEVFNVLEKYEPRIEVLDVISEKINNQIRIEIIFKVKQSDITDSKLISKTQTVFAI